MNHVLSIAFALLIGVGLFGGAGVFLMAVGLPAVIEGARSLKWETVEGRLTKADVHADGQGADIVYRYSAAGREFEASRLSWEVAEEAADSSHTRVISAKAAFARRHEAGDAVVVYYDPRVPWRSVLEPGVPRGASVMVGMGIPFTGIGIAFVILVAELIIAGPERKGGLVRSTGRDRWVYRRARIGFVVKGCAGVLGLPIGLGWSLWSWYVGPPQVLWPLVLLLMVAAAMTGAAGAAGFVLIRRGWFHLVIDRGRGVLVPPRGLSSDELPPIPLAKIRRIGVERVEKFVPQWVENCSFVAEVLSLRLETSRAGRTWRRRRGFQVSSLFAEWEDRRGLLRRTELLWFGHHPKHAEPLRDWIVERSGLSSRMAGAP